MGKHKNAAKGETGTQKGAFPSLSSHGGDAGDTGNTIQDLMEEVASLEKYYHRWALLPKCPFDSHDPAYGHPNDLYHLIINVTAQ